MELYQEILAKILQNERIDVRFPDLYISVNDIINQESYNALQKIKAIIHDDSLDDTECFAKIEEIICLFEAMGSSGGSRHDFG
ncbi:MAG: hypothetical protein J6J18_12675 [Oscillospiraceae bacterium]|nr:hypothetical protein [Oscillospiraceae bacterium]